MAPQEELRRGRPATVAVASGEAGWRRRIARAIASHPDLRPVGRAADGTGAARLIAAKHPDVALLDIPLDGLDEIWLCEWITAHRPEWRTRVVLLDSRPDPASVAQAATAGAAGYIDRSMPEQRLREAVARVARGGTTFAPAAAA